MIIWMTGQPGSGKTTLCNLLSEHYEESNSKCIHIDGDNLREMTGNFDYTPEGRNKNILNAQMLARFLHKNNFLVFVSLVAPYKNLRELFKSEMGKELIEFYIHCGDVRGKEQYFAKDYQPPEINYYSIDTTIDSPQASFEKILGIINDL